LTRVNPAATVAPRRSLFLASGLLLIPALLAAGCRSGGPWATAHETAQDALAAMQRRIEAMRRGLESRAAEARNDLESARDRAEGMVRQHARRPEAAAREARRQAGRALQRGSEVLRQAARDGSAEAAGWARVIQERMMRLEESLDALAGGGREHADS
jgi:ElaB/YqjD/DUF883 family membrane-anchored ribosome-binding protein